MKSHFQRMLNEPFILKLNYFNWSLNKIQKFFSKHLFYTRFAFYGFFGPFKGPIILTNGLIRILPMQSNLLPFSMAEW